MKIFTKKELEEMKKVFGKDVMSEEFLRENPKILDAIRAEIFMRRKNGKSWFKKYEKQMEEERKRQLKIK